MSVLKNVCNLRRVSSRNIGSLTTTNYLHDILATKALPYVPELDGRRLLGRIIWVGGGVDWESLVVAERIDSMIWQVTGMVYWAVVDYLNQRIFLIRDVRVIDIDQAICAAWKDDIVMQWMEL